MNGLDLEDGAVIRVRTSGAVLARGRVEKRDAVKMPAVTGLGSLHGRDVRVRFVGEDVSLYAFWFSDAKGASRGYLAGGGPGYAGLRDE